MTLKMTVELLRWPTRERFVNSRGAKSETRTVLVTLRDSWGFTGRGEACGVDYAGETPELMAAQIDQVRPAVESTAAGREELLKLLPSGGARCALDGALWDLEAKRTGVSAFTLAGISVVRPVTTAYTIGIRTLDGYEAAANERSCFAFLKVKVDRTDPIAAVAAVRRGAPRACLIVDSNQAWSIDELKHFAPQLADFGVVLLEQPIAIGEERGLDGYRCPIKLCADELIYDVADIEKARGRFDVINIKLDKCGGLTAALRIAATASSAGFELMVGCFGGSSLCMAPGMVLAQQCAFADLDGPLLSAADWPEGFVYHDGLVEPSKPALWG